MKTYLNFLAFLTISISLNAQKPVAEIIPNIDEGEAIQIVEAAAKQLNYNLDKYDSKNKILVTDFFEWTSIAITNHARLRFDVGEEQLVISMIERQYKSDEGWSDAPTNLSKKNYKKYVGNFVEKVKEIAYDDEKRHDAVFSSELIKPFCRTVVVDSVEWHFVKGEKNVPSGYKETQQLDSENVVIEATITNNNKKPISIYILSPMYNTVGSNGWTTIGSRAYINFDELSIKWNRGVKTTEVIMEPGESKHLFVCIQKTGNSDREFQFFYKIRFKQNIKKEGFDGFINKYVYNYNVPVPFE